jgi:hypothetical protein
MNATQADAFLHRYIRRLMTTRGTTSDHLLILADALDEAAQQTTAPAEAEMLTTRAADLRKMAPAFAEAPVLTREDAA